MAVTGADADAIRVGARRAAVLPSVGSRRPLGTEAVNLEGGLLAAWQERNRSRTIPHAIASMTTAGNLDDLRAAVDGPGERPVPRYPFLDTDVYKTLEGVAYEVGRGAATAEMRAFLHEATDVLERVQAADGYIGSYVQRPGSDREPWSDLAWGHELYNLGHLIQAAVADSRQGGDGRLLAVARRFADAAVREFGPGARAEVCGHPEVEMALVELHRETGSAPTSTSPPRSSTGAATARWRRGSSRPSTSRTRTPSARCRPSPATPSAWRTSPRARRTWRRRPATRICSPPPSACSTTPCAPAST